MACRDGRLERLPGIGARRAAMLLDVNREYQDKAKRRLLRTIAPKRFNRDSEASLPILHTERGAWHFAVLFSNTACAYELHRTRDWMVVYFHGDSEPEGQHTIVTKTRGSLVGKRVVRGREDECRTYYETPPASIPGLPANREQFAKR